MRNMVKSLFVMLCFIPLVALATTPPPACPPLGSVNLTGVVHNVSKAVVSSIGPGEALSSNTSNASLKITNAVALNPITGGFTPTMNLSVETGAGGASLSTSTGAGTSLGETKTQVAGLSKGSISPSVDGVGNLPMNGGTNGVSTTSTKTVDNQDASSVAGSKATLSANGVITLVDGVSTLNLADNKLAIGQVGNAGTGATTANAGATSIFSTSPINIKLPVIK